MKIAAALVIVLALLILSGILIIAISAATLIMSERQVEQVA